VIRSGANAHLKRIGAARAGKEPGVLVLEGERLIADAARAGARLDLLLVAEGRAEPPAAIVASARETRRVAAALMERLSALVTSPGLLALGVAPPAPRLRDLVAGPRSLLLVAAGVADPGNLGALARSAEAAGAAGLVVISGGASPWNEKALRGSMGSLLRVPVVAGAAAETIARDLGERGVRQVAAATRGGVAAQRFDWSGRVALWIGGETGELPAACAGFERVSIPMAGEVESLNVTVAASLLLFAAGRVSP